MAPERLAHMRVKLAVWRALSIAIENAGLPCEAFGDGPAVVTGRHKTGVPDASVQCSRVDDPNSLALDRPLIVVEVMPPTNWRDDFGIKVEEYFSVATIRHCLIIDADERVVLHHRRAEAGRIETEKHRDGWIELDPPGYKLAVHDLFGRR
jgi:Uma2 family endonuclease